jgi:hypothetical protein
MVQWGTAFMPLFAVAAVGTIACSDLSGLVGQGDRGDARADDGGGADGPADDGGGADGPADDGGGADGPVPAALFYVSAASGDDARDGASPSTAKKTIAAALVAAKAAPSLAELHICAGTYEETGLVLDAPISLKGGYGCATWTRLGGYGYPGFDTANETVIASTTSPTLLVQSASVTRATILDGLTILGPTGLATTSRALVVDTAAPTISNDKIIGGSGTSTTGDGSIALVLSTASSADIVHDQIEGGSGSTSATDGYGSVGVSLTPDVGAPHVHSNNIKGGTGSCTGANACAASVGATLDGTSLEAAQGNAFEENVVHGGAGSSAANHNSSIGVIVRGSVFADLVHNQIHGGAGTSSKGQKHGVLSTTTGKLRIRASRIFGGDGIDGFYGISVSGASLVELSNDMVHGGGYSAGVCCTETFAVVLTDVALGNIFVQHNSIYSGNQWQAADAAIGLFGSTQNAVVENNIFVPGYDVNYPSNGYPFDIGLDVGSCSGLGALARLRNNLFANFRGGISSFLLCENDHSAVTSIAAMETKINAAGKVASGNHTLAANCGGDPSCITLPNCDQSDTCFASLYASWSSDRGYTDLMGSGWKLNPNVACAVAGGGLDLTAATPTIAIDAYDMMRTPPVSIGANELDPGARCP